MVLIKKQSSHYRELCFLIEQQHLVIMNHARMRNVICFLIIIILICACNSGLRSLRNMYGKELYSGHQHVFSGIKLILNEDSTFECSEGGLAMKYSKGTWVLNQNKKSITLKSLIFIDHVDNSQIADTVFWNLDNTVVEILNSRKVKINDQILSLKK